MNLATEQFDEVIAEILPLMAAHYAEIERDQMPLELDHDMYRVLESAGALRIYTIRDSHLLLGYASFIVSPSHLHHKGLKYASNDSLYVLPAHRGLTGSRLIAYAEAQLAAEGIKVISLSVPVGMDWMPLSKHWGFQQTEATVTKRMN